MKKGDVLGGKYRVLRTLGEGGMGVVVAAEHVHVNEPVAVKVLKADAALRPETLARFVREARTAMKLKSEHVVRVFDVDMLPGSQPYIVMEMLDGRDLATVISDDGALDPKTAVDWILQACESIAEAHAIGVVHRDLKPANLFLTRRPEGSPWIKVLDFGVSKVAWATEAGGTTEPSSDPKIAIADTTDASAAGLTQTNATLGSPRYMAPEQLRSARDVDTRADVWALGATLFELLTGRAPFVGATTEEIAGAVRSAPMPSLRALRPTVSSGLEAVVARCLRKDPSERWSDVAALSSALAPHGTDEARRSAARVHAILGVEPPRAPRRRARLAATVLALGGVAVAVFYAATPRHVPSEGARDRPAVALASSPPPSPPDPAPLVVAQPSMTTTAQTTTKPALRARATPSDAGADARTRVDPVHAFDDPE